MIQLLIPLSQRPSLYAGLLRRLAQRTDKFCVIGDFHGNLPGAKFPEVTLCTLSGRDVKIIRIHGLVRRQEHYRLRLQPADRLRRILIRINSLLNILFLTAAHFGYDERWMRYHEPC